MLHLGVESAEISYPGGIGGNQGCKFPPLSKKTYRKGQNTTHLISTKSLRSPAKYRSESVFPGVIMQGPWMTSVIAYKLQQTYLNRLEKENVPGTVAGN